MSAVAAITLADALATPVNHNFIPLGPDAKGVWWYEDQSQIAPVGFWRISVSLTRSPSPSVGSSAAGRVSRVKISVHEPQLETLSNAANGLTPAPQVAFITRSMVEFVLPERSSLQNRKDIRKMTALLLGDLQVVNMIENLQGVF